ncbi:MAG: 2,4-dihydroxyacetophenone dioxygenase [Sphingomonadales bacterium 63-6]|nr:MAG: 2,4-dihydroxyacetophenone dioxygenase [Sphingomonadales bacterium 63-6]
MAEAATSEFWKDIKPIPEAFRPGAAPESYMPKIAEGDPRYWVPMSETVSSKPVWISPTRNMWADVLYSSGPGLVNRHYHPQPIWAYTISGKWGYLEHSWTATAGDFIYETPGESHTLVAYDHPDPMRVFFVVSGPLMWLDEDGKTIGHYDVFDYMRDARAHYDKVGIPADYLDSLIR